MFWPADAPGTDDSLFGQRDEDGLVRARGKISRMPLDGIDPGDRKSPPLRAELAGCRSS